MKQIFINLPVKDVEASMQFYTALGFTVNPLFTFDDQKCMVWSDQIYLMLQSKEMFAKGNKKSLPDAKQYTIASFTLVVDSEHQMNEMMQKGLQAGGTTPTDTIDEGYMQVRNIEDLDGHQWAVIHVDIDKFKNSKGR